MDTLLAGLILTATLLLILIRPGGVSEAWWAALGGGLTLTLGLVSLGQAGAIVIETQDALILLVGMMVLSAVAEEAGFFAWAASVAARLGGGRVWKLYVMVFVVGTLVTAFLSLDATVIVLTPIVYGMVLRLRLSPLPFMFACSYTANTASLFLPVSNLTNLLAYNNLDLRFSRFVLVMFLPALMAILTNAAIFLWIFRRDLGGFYEEKFPRFVPENRTFFRVAAGGLGAVLAAFFLAPVIGIPIGLVALGGAALVGVYARSKGWISFRSVWRSVSWGILILVVGLFLVVQGVENAGLTSLVERALAATAPGDGLLDIAKVAVGTALGSNVINNVPMAVVALNSLEPLLTDGSLQPAVAYATLLGTNVGPNLTVVGSLATLLWLSIMRGRGLEITAWEYLKIGVISTPFILFAATLGLWASIRLFGG